VTEAENEKLLFEKEPDIELIPVTYGVPVILEEMMLRIICILIELPEAPKID
jgi:hypothetical protein